MTVFSDQKLFMNICGQQPSNQMADLYKGLVDEEYQELLGAWDEFNGDRTCEKMAEVTDACMDLVYVTSGLMHSLGLDPQAFWDEVQRSNLSKASLLPDGSYRIERREDGKIKKPQSYSPPDLLTIVRRQHECQ